MAENKAPEEAVTQVDSVDGVRSVEQRRRLLVAVAAGIPTIVAGSAQTAYANGTGSYSGK